MRGIKTSLGALLVGSLGAVNIFAQGPSAAGPAFNARDPYKEALIKRLSFIFKDEKLDRTHLSVQVFSLSRQESLFELNADAGLSPASAIKLLPAAVSLKKLGPDFTYKTDVLVDGPIQNGVLKGNIYLRGGGDPSLVTERLYLLVADVLRADINKITGSIIVDDWTFDQVKIDPRRIPTETDRAYNAPIGGLSFNYNSTTVFFRPGDSVGSRPRAYVEPDTGYIRVVNKARTAERNAKYSLTASRQKGNAGDTLVIEGAIPMGMPEQHSYFNITNPPIYAGQAFRYLLEQRGVKFAGEIKHAETPATAKKIAVLESLPLREIVTLMDKYSNNFIAETLVKTLGREVLGKPGTTDKGLQVLREEATRLGVNTAGFNLVSGSGLTRDNRISGAQFITFLNATWLDFDVLPELLSSLPIAGRDGTLRSRMKGTSAFGRLRGKTGTIDGVSSLVGVVQSKGGELLAFAVVMNDKTQNSGSLRPWQNYFGQALADFNRKTPLPEQPGPLPDIVEPASAQNDVGGR